MCGRTTGYRGCGEGRKRHRRGGVADATSVGKNRSGSPSLTSQDRVKGHDICRIRTRFSFFEDPDSPRNGLDVAALAALEGEERSLAEDMLPSISARHARRDRSRRAALPSPRWCNCSRPSGAVPRRSSWQKPFGKSGPIRAGSKT
jgi:hypothetical protein